MKNKLIAFLVRQRNWIVFRYYDFLAELEKKELPVNQEAKFIASIASYPKRDHFLPAVFQALGKQTYPPKKWVLVLTAEEYPNGLPKHLVKLENKGVEILWVSGNSYAVKKLVPVIEKYPDLGIVTLDDDIIYHDWVLNNLVDNNFASNNMVTGHSGKALYRIGSKLSMFQRANKKVDENTSSIELYFLGLGGIFYPPYSLDNKVLNFEAIKKNVPGRGSDMWFWGATLLNGTFQKCISYPKGFKNFGIPIPETKQTVTREAPSHEDLDKRFQKVIDYFGIREKLLRELPDLAGNEQ
jgi:hypothetical protein